MATSTEDSNSSLPPDDAFGVLGNEIRMAILRTLGEADCLLSFSELRDRVGVSDSGQFNYHLDKLVGHFIRQSDEGYELKSAGQRVIESVLSGAITETPELTPTQTDVACHHCGAPIFVSYRHEWMTKYCPQCSGTYGESASSSEIVPEEMAQHGFLGGHTLPPAGIQDRTPSDIVQVGRTWGVLEKLAAAKGVCPRCTAPVEESVSACESHECSDGLCEQCDRLHAVQLHVDCTNCPFSKVGAFVNQLFAETGFLAFLTSRGIDPFEPTPEFIKTLQDAEEEVLSTDPFKARFTFTADGDTLTLTVDDELSVVNVPGRANSEHPG